MWFDNWFKFKFMAVGPITVQKEKGKLRIRENKLWTMYCWWRGNVSAVFYRDTEPFKEMGMDDFRRTNYEFRIRYCIRLHIHGKLLLNVFIFFRFTLCNFCQLQQFQ